MRFPIKALAAPLALLCAAALSAQAASPLPPADAAPAYDIDVAADPATGSLSGRFTVSCPVAPGQTALYLRQMLNLGEKQNPKVSDIVQKRGPRGFTPSSSSAEAVAVDGQPASSSWIPLPAFFFQSYNTDRVIQRIEIPEASRGKSSVTLTFTYKARISDLISMDDVSSPDFLASRFSWFPTLVPEGKLSSSLLFPFSYRASLSSSQGGWELAPTGSSFSRGADGSWKLSSERPVASLPLVLMKGFQSYELPLDFRPGASVKLFYRPGSGFDARALSTYARDALASYESEYCPLDYRTVSIVQGLPLGGFYGEAADSLVLLGSASFDGLETLLPRFFDNLAVYVISHELGHFWFGVGTPPDFTSENYLSEGLNELSTMRFLESRYGTWDNTISPDANDLLSLSLKAISYGHSFRSQKYLTVSQQAREGWVYPLSHDPKDAVLNAASATDYSRAQLILEMLQSSVGTETFDAGLKAYAVGSHGTGVDTASFRAAIEKASGRDLGPFFAAYVTGTEGIDYHLSGSLNARKAGGYGQRLSVSFSGKGPFVPVTLRLTMAYGTTRDIAVEKPGELDIDTPSPVSSAILDPDFRSIDYRRLDNVLPLQVAFETPANYSLTESGAALTVSPALGVYQGGGTAFLGEGLSIGLPTYWSLAAIPLVGIGGPDPAHPEALPAGVAALSLSDPRGLSASLRAFTASRDRLDSLSLGATWTPALPMDYGYQAKYFDLPLTLSADASLDSLPYVAFPGTASFDPSATLSLNLAQKAGFTASLSESASIPLDGSAYANSLSLAAEKIFVPLPQTLLELQVGGSWSTGNLALLGASNAVPGFQASATSRSFGASASAFLGWALVNGRRDVIMRGLFFQSLHLGLSWNGATAFDSPDELASTFRQSVGLVLIPSYRSMEDLTVSSGIGLYLDPVRIASAPKDPQSWLPSLAVEAKVSSLIGSLLAY